MSTWRIHLGWVVVTALAIAITARVASRRSPEVLPMPPRPNVSPAEIVPAATRQPQEAPHAEATPLTTNPTPPAASATGLADKIRAMLSDTHAMDEVKELIDGIGDREFKLTLLKEALAGSERQANYTALYILRTMKGRDVAKIIESFMAAHLNDEPGWVAAYALGELGDPESVGPLNEALRTGNDEVRLYSSAALLKLGYPSPADQMLAEYARQFESSDGLVRRKAIEHIRTLAPEGAIPVLERALKDPNGDVRREGVRGFSRVGKLNYLPLLEPLADDPVPEVAKEAKSAIERLKSNP